MKDRFYVVLPDYAGRQIALVPEGKGFNLPEFSREAGIRYHTVETVNDAVLSDWHLPVIVSRCLKEGQNSDPAIFALHNRSQSWKLPTQAKWVPLHQLKEIEFNDKEAKICVLDWLSSEENDSWKHIPWSSSSWFDRATAWINESVQRSGATVIGAPVQIRVWALSCVFRVSTSAGTVYFKALPDFFGHEPKLMQYLSQHFAQYMIDVVAIEPDQHWMLTRELVGPEPKSKQDWQETLRTLILIQKHCQDHFDDLLALGCPDRRLARLPALLEPVLEELKLSEMREFYGVNEDEATELAHKLRSLPALRDKLADCGIPETIVHGDLWGPNVVIRETATAKYPIIFDWTDASISHPFVDIYCVTSAEKDDARRQDQKQAHIDVWGEVMPPDAVVTAYDLSEQLAPYYYLLAYRNVQLNAPPQARWELSYLLHRFVQTILDASNAVEAIDAKAELVS